MTASSLESPLLLLVATTTAPGISLVADALGERGVSLERVEDVAPAVGRLRATGRAPDAVVLAGDEAWQRAGARQLRYVEARVVLVFLVEPAREASVRQALLFEPAIGHDMHVVPLGPPAEVGARLESIATATVRRIAHRAVLGKINAQLSRTRPEPGERNLEAALRDQQERLALAVQAAELGTWDYGVAARRLRWDDRCKAIFGLPAEAEISYDDFVARVHPDDRGRVEAQVSHAFESGGGGRFHSEYRVLGSFEDGQRWASVQGRAFFDDSGQAVRLLGTIQDISARKRADEERADLLRQAQVARAEAEAASLLKDEFLATVSHELRTPLTAILGWTTMLRLGTLPPEKSKQALETIERNARAQTQLIEDLLDFSRILAGKLRLDIQPLDLVAVVQASIESVRPAADGRQIRLQVLLDPSAGAIVGDAGRLQQVVWNLLTNAIKFTPKGGRVQVRLERIESSVEIIVSDSGQGIRPDFLPHVFERFRQADGSTMRTHGGLGLGLAIVKQLTELHGGTVRAHSEGEGTGATFIVRLPLAAIHSDPEARRRAHPRIGEPAGFECPPEIARLRILVVDDEPDTRALLVAVLEECGASVTAVGRVADALDEISHTRPDVVVSDIGMPGEDGFSLIRQLRALPAERGGRTPVVALTAYARGEDRTRALRAGFSMHVAKPIDPGELLAVIANLAGRTPAPRA